MDFEGQFLKTYRILKWDEFTVLNNNRALLSEKVANKVVTKNELLTQFKVELSLLNACKEKIQEVVDNHGVIDVQVVTILSKRVIDLFDQIHVLFSMDEGLLSYYINFCMDNVNSLNAEQLNVLLDAVLCTVDNKSIWIQLLKLYMKLDSVDKLLNVFHEGVRSLKEDSLPLWLMMIRHFKSRRPDMLQGLFDEGSNISYETINMEMKPKYLIWCMEYQNIDETRKLFNVLKELNPPCCKLYQLMIHIESEEPDANLDTIKKLHGDASELFGRHNAEVWLDYARFLHVHGTRKCLTDIFNRAIMRLEANLKNIFLDGFNNYKREFMRELGKEVIVIDD